MDGVRNTTDGRKYCRGYVERMVVSRYSKNKESNTVREIGS